MSTLIKKERTAARNVVKDLREHVKKMSKELTRFNNKVLPKLEKGDEAWLEFAIGDMLNCMDAINKVIDSVDYETD